MLGNIGIADLKVHCIVGIYPMERKKKQDLFIDIELVFDFEKVSTSANIDDTINYAEIAEKVTQMGIENKYQLIETYAEDCAELVLGLSPDVRSTTVTIKKPGAIPSAAYAYVSVEREQKK